MKEAMIATSVCALLLASAANAQDEDGDGLTLMEEGARLFFRGLMSEVEPTLDDLRELTDDMRPALRSFVEEMGPAMTELFEKIDDISNYRAPEILPNGDIIIRRKPEAPPLELDGIEI